MLIGIDHIVVVVANLQHAIEDYAKLGFTVVPGGRHTTGTENALIGFADGAYVELLAFYEPSPTHRWFPALQRGGGLTDFCAQTNSLDEDVLAFRQAGIEMSSRSAMSRVRPDGYKLDWVLANPDNSKLGVVPFLIEDITPRIERAPKKITHANGVSGIDTLTVAVVDPTLVKSWYSQILKRDPESVERPDLDASGLRFKIGPHEIDFEKPNSSASPLSPWLEERGPSLYTVTLKALGSQTASKSLNPFFYVKSA